MEPLPFDDHNEQMYIRVKEEHIALASVLPAVVAIPDWSANRSKLSAPDDVLDAVKFPDYTRVAEFDVVDIPNRIEPDPVQSGQASATPWLFWAEHDPIDGNDAHSEVRMRKSGEEYVRAKEPASKAYRKKIRNELAKIIRVR